MLVMYALVMPVTILFCGLVFDVGLLEYTKLRMQSAADAAAMGAELEAERNSGNVTTVAQGIASLNGFTDDGGKTTTVALVMSPTNQGYYSGRYDTFQVNISQKVPTVFMGTVTSNTFTMSASSTSVLPPCFYALNSKNLVTYAISIGNASNQGTVLSSDCPIYAKGNMYSNSNTYVGVPEALLTGSNGGSSLGGTLNYGVNYGSSAISDPLASVTQPSFGGSCAHTGYSFTTSGGAVTLSPGTYCGGMTLGNNQHDSCSSCITTVTLNPGLYVISGGASWRHISMTGTGVTFFFTSGGGSSYGTICICDQSNLSVSAPTSSSGGSLAGILFFLDRNWSNSGTQDFVFDSSYSHGDGIWYMPDTGLNFNNGTETMTCASSCVLQSWGCAHYCTVVADNFVTSYSVTYLADNFSSISGGNPFRTQSVLVQ